MKQTTIAFVEVKYRNKLQSSRADEYLLSFRKRQSLRFGAQAFVAREYRRTGMTYRFDLAVVTADNRISYRVGVFE